MELFKLLGKVAIEGTDEAKKDINKVTQDAAEAGKKLASGFGNVMATVAKVGVAAVTTASAGIIALTKSAVSNYSEYEQLVGGVETLFKNSSNKVMKYANEAYKTAGLSANAYMETVTSFSASLLQGLGGDTEKAAQIADKAIVDMSDNANKMGSSMESIQNAYQGFAKQNYTMLDNLKLGYGGTASEMARLINDSGVLGDTMEVTAKTVNDVSFDKIIEAIHVVQDNLGITGTTAKEAATTIQGSISQMKAAWTNFITGMADSEQDMNQLMGNVVDSFITVADNIVPRIMETLPRLIQGISKLTKKLIPYIPPILKELIPAIVEGATDLLREVVTNLPSILESLFGEIGGEIGSVISDSLQVIIPTIANFVKNILPPLVSAIGFIAENFDTLVTAIGFAVAAFETMSIVNTVTTAIQGASSAFGAFSAVLAANPIGLVVTAIGGLALGLSALSNKYSKNNEYINANIIAAREDAAQARETAESYNQLKSSIAEKVQADLGQIDTTEQLWNELKSLSDSQGNIKEQDQERAELIAGQLQEALGIEIDLTNGQIQGYEDLDQAVKNVIETKKAQIYLQAHEEEYANAVKNYNSMMAQSAEQLARIHELEAQKEQALDEQTRIVHEQMALGYGIANNDMVEAAQDKLNAIEVELNAEQAAYDTNLETFKSYVSDIEAYETASTAMAEGNAEKVIDTYKNKDAKFKSSADIHGEITDDIKKQFEDQQNAAEANYQFIKENYEKGFNEFSDTMLKEAAEDALLAKQEFKNVGGNMTDGISEGAENGRSSLQAKLRSIIRSALNAAQEEAQIHSPSRLFRDQVGAYISEGIGEGVEENEDKAIRPVEDTIKKMSDAGIGTTSSYMAGNTNVNAVDIASTDNSGMENLLERMIEVQNKIYENLPDMLAEAMTSVKMDFDKREFGRLIRQVNV